MFRKILIANRGEIAVRVLRACMDLGIRTVAVYSSVDRAAPHVRLAHEAYSIGPAPAKDSYLRIDKILDVAKRSGAEAIHPGYGFLAENALFAEACRDAGVVFIGPPPAAMRAMGDKIEARARMIAAGVPVVPGTGAFRGDAGQAAEALATIGLPVMIKAAAGGGGKGMRIVRSEAEFANSLERARSEALASFGDDTVYIERYVERPRHIEVQVLFDEHGQGVHLGERECSIQRRHQKLIEETPSPVVDPETRERLGALALSAARAAGYVGAGTVEFLRGADGSFFFMEMNARLQVEHPVTEEVYGRDLVKAQIRIAAGEKLRWTQEDLVPSGHSMECRITAEDPAHGFMPCPGRIQSVRVPSGPGVRDDSAVASGYDIPIHYDPLVAKLITWGRTREEVIRRMRRALDEYRLEGITTNIPFLRAVLDHPEFERGELHTGFLEEHGDSLAHREDPWLDEIAVVAAAIHAYRARTRAALGAEAVGNESSQESKWSRIGRARRLGSFR